MTTIVIAKADDWIGFYQDGALKIEGHQIDPVVAMRFAMGVASECGIGIEIEEHWVNLDWISDVGSLPSDIKDVIWDGDPYDFADTEIDEGDEDTGKW